MNGLEPRVLDYTSQQAKVVKDKDKDKDRGKEKDGCVSKRFESLISQVLPPIALAMGLHLAASSVWEMYNTVQVLYHMYHMFHI